MRWFIALVVLLVTGSASAQPTAPPPPDRMSATQAVALSAGATLGSLAFGVVLLSDDSSGGVVGAGLLFFSVVAAPSLGNLLLDEQSDALIGAGVRVVGAGAVAYGLSSFCVTDCGGNDGPSIQVIAASVIGGAVVFLGGVGYDLVTQSRNARAGRVRVGAGGAGLAVRVGL